MKCVFRKGKVLGMDMKEFIKEAERLNVLGIQVTKDNKMESEWYKEAQCRRNVYSVTKSFTSCAVGFAVQEGLLSLDEKLTEAFSEDLPEDCSSPFQNFTNLDFFILIKGNGMENSFYLKNG